MVIAAAVERAGVEPASVDEVVIGQTKQSADAANLARVAALKAGFPVEVPAYTVMRQCGSGLQAVGNALQAIRAGDAEIVVAGGVESMSLAPYYLRGARFGLRLRQLRGRRPQHREPAALAALRGLRRPHHGAHRRERRRALRRLAPGPGRLRAA